MEITFKNAVVISIAVHLLIIGPFNGLGLLEHQARQKPLVVDYVILKEAVKKIEETKALQAKAVETPRVEIRKEAEIKKEAQAKVAKVKEAQPAAKPREALKAQSAKDALKEASKKEARIKSTKEYVSYYNLIREKIRRRLKENYRDYPKEGDVYLTFTLSTDGTLLAHNIDAARSSPDETLQGLAALSLEEAAPFGRFPKALTVPKMSFNVLISFRKR
jgi:outer membrane biosynthesis protein TonB